MSTSSTAQFRKILVCTDSTPGSAGTINAGLELSRLTSASLRLLEVVTSPVFPDQVTTDYELLRVRQEEAQARLAQHQANAAKAGISVEVEVATGVNAYDGILEAAATYQPSMIIVGRKGSGKLARLLMGSVTSRVLGLSPYSVMIVPRDAVLALKTILIAHDCSEYAEAAWREIIPLAKLAKSKVIAVMVAKDERRELDGQLVLQHLKASAERHGIYLEAVLLKGRPFEQIIATARDEKVGLVAMGSHGRTGLSRLLMGSVTERVVGMLSCPVLVAKRPKRDAQD